MPTAEKIRISTEAAMTMALRDYFDKQTYLLLPQVRNGVGYARVPRTADALAMGLWPSRGLHLYGIEIKVSRSDWMRELKDPKKSDDIGKHCDFWMIAAGSDDIVRDGELPPGWGLLVPGKKEGSLRLAAAPSQIKDVKPIDRGFLASILKKTMESAVPMKEVDEEIRRRVAEQVKEKEKVLTEEISRKLGGDRILKRNIELEAIAEAFHKASGVYMADSVETARKFGAALRALQWGGVEKFMEYAETSVRQALLDITEIRSVFVKLPTEPPVTPPDPDR